LYFVTQKIIFDPKDSEAENSRKLDLIHRSREQKYAFDKVYTTQDIKTIYSETVHNLIHPVLNGFNGCVFAYGATGTGKTHTMLGATATSGLCSLALKDIYSTSAEAEYQDYIFNVKVCYVEIYNEAIRDLLDGSKSNKYLDLRDDPNKGIEIAGVSEIEVKSEKEVVYAHEILTLLHQGNKRRTTEATNANQTSSRSHAIFQVLIGKTEKSKNTTVEMNSSKLSLIDLAGSERGTSTGNRGIRMMEGAKINRSLLALGNCINALGDKSKKG
jgi:kinesin family protein 18/19